MESELKQEPEAAVEQSNQSFATASQGSSTQYLGSSNSPNASQQAAQQVAISKREARALAQAPEESQASALHPEYIHRPIAMSANQNSGGASPPVGARHEDQEGNGLYGQQSNATYLGAGSSGMSTSPTHSSKHPSGFQPLGQNARPNAAYGEPQGALPGVGHYQPKVEPPSPPAHPGGGGYPRSPPRTLTISAPAFPGGYEQPYPGEGYPGDTYREGGGYEGQGEYGRGPSGGAGASAHQREHYASEKFRSQMSPSSLRGIEAIVTLRGSRQGYEQADNASDEDMGQEQEQDPEQEVEGYPNAAAAAKGMKTRGKRVTAHFSVSGRYSPEGQPLQRGPKGGGAKGGGIPMIEKSRGPQQMASNDGSDMDPDDEEDDVGVTSRLPAPGKETTGRWQKHEHESFLKGLDVHGKHWKKVAAEVGSRTVVQTRTHAQKYFQKLGKNGEDVPPGGHYALYLATGGGDFADDELPSPMAGKRRAQGTNAGRGGAAKKKKVEVRGPGEGKRVQFPGGGQGPRRHDLDTNDEEAASLMASLGQGHPRRNKLSIVAPDPQTAPKRYPAPSPAACGTRKQQELDAADMLYSMQAPKQPFGLQGAYPPSAKANPGLRITNPDEIGGSPAMYDSGVATPWDNELRKLLGSSVRWSQGQHGSSTAGPHGARQVIPTERHKDQEKRDKETKKEEGEADVPRTLGYYIYKGQVQKVMDILREAELAHREAISTPTAASPTAATDAGAPPNGEGGAVPSAASPTAAQGGDHMDTEPPLPQPPVGLPPVPPALEEPAPMEADGGSDDAIAAAAAQALAQAARDREFAEKEKIAAAEMPKPPPRARPRPVALVVPLVDKEDDWGFTPLMVAASLDLAKAPGHNPGEMVRVAEELLRLGADVQRRDRSGNTPLHWAAHGGNYEVVQLLIQHKADLNAKNFDGDTPLHVASKEARQLCVHKLLEKKAATHLRNNKYRSALDEAASGLNHSDQEHQQHREEIRREFFQKQPTNRTLVLWHPECSHHKNRSDRDWECPERIGAVMGPLRDPLLFRSYELEISNNFERAPVEALLRVHTPEYITFLDNLSHDLMGGGAAVPFTPMVQRTLQRRMSVDIKPDMNCDTSFSAGSLQAARRAAGAVTHAVDSVLAGNNRNAFCVIRPPGHHAGPGGLLPGAVSCGFCIFNNVCVGALHALELHNLARVAIVDWDAHHGNGTEEIVKAYPDPHRLLFFSMHLYEKEEKYEFFPGTGEHDNVAHNIINVPLEPKWKAEARAGALHTRARSVAQQQRPTPSAWHMSGRQAARHAITTRLLPALRAFNPQLILLSAGFDAGEGDVGNAKHVAGSCPVAEGIDLKQQDYAWMTRQIAEVAEICCQGRMVSVLEGGYGQVPRDETTKKAKGPPGSMQPPALARVMETASDRSFSSSEDESGPREEQQGGTVVSMGYQAPTPDVQKLNREALGMNVAYHVRALVDRLGSTATEDHERNAAAMPLLGKRGSNPAEAESGTI